MKIIAYEVREDERPYFYELEENLGAELILTQEVPSLENGLRKKDWTAGL
ncbi:MAG: hypothetical protein LUH19_09715 [Lachnospiraceae bacterium]|nr:hypothetical protein [Lachnospiraceae bacterium]